MSPPNAFAAAAAIGVCGKAGDPDMALTLLEYIEARGVRPDVGGVVSVWVCVCVCARARARTCVRSCVRVCVRARARVRAHVET